MLVAPSSTSSATTARSGQTIRNSRGPLGIMPDSRRMNRAVSSAVRSAPDARRNRPFGPL